MEVRVDSDGKLSVLVGAYRGEKKMLWHYAKAFLLESWNYE
jgi:hypothetical protein